MAAPSPYDIDVVRLVAAPVEDVYRSFADPGEFGRWYGPPGFPVDPASIEIEARAGGPQRFAMVGEADPSMRTAFDGRFVEVVPNERLVSTGAWHGIPGQTGPWDSNLRVEFSDRGGATELVVREGPHPPGTADVGRQAWELMFEKLEATLR